MPIVGTTVFDYRWPTLYDFAKDCRQIPSNERITLAKGELHDNNNR